ncbi:MAG: extracellular solute-binding protein [Deltaproteobacteria bacterium]|nr:extracellular solute-binding protein [Deltaproteobacteria bacterium]
MKLRDAGILFVLGIWLILSYNPANAASLADVALYRGADRQARLENAAKAEGEFTWYTTLSAETNRKMLEAFQKLYPFIQPKLVRLSSDRLVRRYTTEYQAKSFLADVLDTNDSHIEFFRRKGMLQPYYTPMAEKFDKRFIHPQSYWVANRVTMTLLGYNTRLVKPTEVPQRYEDLLDPKWKDKMSMEREDAPWFMALMEYWGEQKGEAFFQRLRSQNPRIRSGHTHLAQLIAAGEDFLSPNAHSQGMASGKRLGAPVDWANLEPVVAASNVSALAKNAPHPNAALIFLDFMLSRDGGQKVIREVNRIPTHPEVLPDPARLREGFDFIVIDPVKYNDHIDRYSKLWHGWFLQ